jgi:hypothetical protein
MPLLIVIQGRSSTYVTGGCLIPRPTQIHRQGRAHIGPVGLKLTSFESQFLEPEYLKVLVRRVCTPLAFKRVYMYGGWLTY